MSWLWDWVAGGGPGWSAVTYMGTRVALTSVVAQHWLRDSVSPPEGVRLVLHPEQLEKIREALGEAAAAVPDFPLEVHQQYRVVRRLRTWEAYVPRFMIDGVAVGIFALEVDALPARTRVKLVGVDPPKPPRRPRGGRRVRQPRPVPQMPGAWAPGWA